MDFNMAYKPRTPCKPCAAELYEARQIARATYFTVCAFLGVGTYDTREAPTLDAALALAAQLGRRCMIYAVTPEGYSIHVRNWEPPRAPARAL
jgi:hypothetical protein